MGSAVAPVRVTTTHCDKWHNQQGIGFITASFSSRASCNEKEWKTARLGCHLPWHFSTFTLRDLLQVNQALLQIKHRKKRKITTNYTFIHSSVCPLRPWGIWGQLLLFSLRSWAIRLSLSLGSQDHILFCSRGCQWPLAGELCLYSGHSGQSTFLLRAEIGRAFSQELDSFTEGAKSEFESGADSTKRLNAADTKPVSQLFCWWVSTPIRYELLWPWDQALLAFPTFRVTSLRTRCRMAWTIANKLLDLLFVLVILPPKWTGEGQFNVLKTRWFNFQISLTRI